MRETLQRENNSAIQKWKISNITHSQKLVTFSTVNRKERAYSSQMNQKIRMCHSIDDRAEEFR